MYNVVVDSSCSINTCFDGSIHIDYIGEDRNKKQVLHELFNTVYSVYTDEIIVESRLIIKQSGAFLVLYVKDSNSTKLSDVCDFVNEFIDVIGDTNEKNTNKHD